MVIRKSRNGTRDLRKINQHFFVCFVFPTSTKDNPYIQKETKEAEKRKTKKKGKGEKKTNEKGSPTKHQKVFLEGREGFVAGASTLQNFENVESDGFGKWTALTNNDDVTFFHQESWRNVASDVFVALLVTVVLWNVVQVVATNNDRSFHFGGDNGTAKNSSANGNVSGERALFVDVGAFNSFARSFVAQTSVLEVSGSSFVFQLDVLGEHSAFATNEDGWLLLESFFRLISGVGSH